MKGVHAGDSTSALGRGGLPSVLLALLMVFSVLTPLMGPSAVVVSAESLSSWSKDFRLHEGLPSDAGDYDWMNTSEPQNPNIPYLDYDSDGEWGISIGKPLPSEKWRHFWVLDPAVNDDVRIQGAMSAHVWAGASENALGYAMSVSVSDMAPGEWSLPSQWTRIAEATTPILGPVYTTIKLHDLTLPSVDYVLAEGHKLVVTIVRNDTMPSKDIWVVYDSDLFDSYLTVPLMDFISVSEAWAEDSESVVRDTFSDTDVVHVWSNLSDPFGSYDISGAECIVRNSTDGSVVVPQFPMVLVEVDPSANSSWSVFTAEVGPLAGGSYVVTVNGSDPNGSPTWMNLTISVVSIDHFTVEAPGVITAFDEFEMTVMAVDSLGQVVPEWRGTVSLAAYEEDMVTLSTDGSLSVAEVEFTEADAGVVTIMDQMYDFAEDTIFIKAVSYTHVGWSVQIVVNSGPVTSIEIEPAEVSDLGSGETQTFTVRALDLNGLENWSWTPVWAVTGEIGTLEPSGFSATLYATSAGEGQVTCEDPATSTTASADVTVVAGALDHIVVTPAGPLTLREGESVSLTAVGYDSAGNTVALSSPAWYTDTSGAVVGSGATVTYTAGFMPEEGTITVSVGSMSASVDVTVTTALNGPWLSTIPTQIVNEDSTWGLNLASYWNHVNGTYYLRWYAEGVDTSLYLVTHDPASESKVSFITQPDKYGTDTFRLWVRDPDGFSDYQDVVVSIQPVNDLPKFVNSPPTEFYVKFNTPYSFDFDYHVWDVDNDKDELRMLSSSSDWGSVVFEGLISSFLFVEKDGRTSYFETMKLTLTDAAAGVAVDSTNSAYLNIVVWVTEDTPPSLNEDLPDIDYLEEGDLDVLVFDLDDYFFDVDEDFLVYEYGFQNIEVVINATTHEVFMSAPYEWSGVTDGTFTAVDPTGAFKADTVTVTVAPVNDAPSVADIRDCQVHFDVPYVIDADMYVNDPDHSFSELEFVFSSPYVSYLDHQIILDFPANLTGGEYSEAYIVEVTMTVEDPDDASGECDFKVTVSDNYPPALTSPVPYPDIMSFAEDTYLNGSLDMEVLFYDLDDSSLRYSVEFESGPGMVNVVIYPDGTVNFTAAANWSGNEVVRFSAFDSHHAWVSWSVTLVVTPVNDAPVIRPIDDLRLVGWPRNFQIMIVQFISDIETPYSQLVVVTTPESCVSAVGFYLYVTMPEDLDEIPVTVYVVDVDGAQSNSVTFTITLSRTTADVIGYPYTFPLVLLAAAVLGYFIASRIPKPYSLENLFLIHNDGRLVAHVTRQENTSIDKDVVSAMFTAVQEFVRDSFQAGEEGLKKLEIGDKSVMIEKGKSVYLAMIYAGWPPKDVFRSMTDLLRDIEERYGENISHWNGTMKAVKGVEPMLQSFMSNRFRAGSWGSEEEMGEEEWVDILSKEP